MSNKSFRVGQYVTFRYGGRSVQGMGKEDRGPIGMKGRVLCLIEFHPETGSLDVSHIELPAEKLEAVERTVTIG